MTHKISRRREGGMREIASVTQERVRVEGRLAGNGNPSHKRDRGKFHVQRKRIPLCKREEGRGRKKKFSSSSPLCVHFHARMREGRKRKKKRD